MDKNNENRNENLSFITDEEALTEIDFGSFLDETSKSAPLFEGFHEDIEKTEKSLENELQSLYDDIMNSGPATIVPKPMSVITSENAQSEEAPQSSAQNGLDELWMNPEEYIDIPVVSLDSSEEEEEFVPEEAFFKPEPKEDNDKTETTPEFSSTDAAKDDIFGMIDSMKSATDGETGFNDILAEIEANTEISPVSNDYNAIEDFLKTLPATPAVYEEETVFAQESNEKTEHEDSNIILPETEAQTDAEVGTVEYHPDEAETIDTDSEEFERELAALLGDETEKVEAEGINDAENNFVVNIPDDGNDYSLTENPDEVEKTAIHPMIFFDADAVAGYEQQVSAEETERVVIGDFEAAKRAAIEADTVETKEEKKARKKKEKEEKKNGEKKPVSKGEIVRRIILSLSFAVMVVCAGILINTYVIQPKLAQKVIAESMSDMAAGEEKYGDAVVNDSIRNEYNVEFPEGMMAKYSQLYMTNSDLRGWISIPAYEINLPIVQGSDNDYYLKRNIYKKWVSHGVPFFDYRIAEEQFKTLPRNTVIYGHNMRSDDLIFGMLEEYRDIDGFKKAPIIECNTIYGDFKWVVCGVFISNSKPKDDNGYVFPYNFIDCSDQDFAEYIVELEKRSFYDTGVDLAVTDKILTLSTCCYDFNDARLVVVARLLREGESVSVDTSKAVVNIDPKGPQAWCDEIGKPNNYASDARWMS